MLKRLLANSRTNYQLPIYISSKPYRCFNLTIKDRIRLEREARLNRGTDILPLETIGESQKIRNIGIIAHIDAGKTTVTERMLYYSGVLDEPGEVHHGNTTMDYLKEERERGITIRSACITFSWNRHHINLIDTPGHIDFNAEVERSLRVLDGAVVIFDSSKGVETQTELVWQQADKYNIPKLAFINKLDKVGSDLQMSLKSIENRLDIKPQLLQIPEFDNVNNEQILNTIIDIVKMEKVTWTDELGNNVIIDNLDKESKIYDQAIKARNQLVETLAEFDDKIADKYLNGEDVDSNTLQSSIRKVQHENSKQVSLVFIGSALKNRGVQALMDGVINYLPSPMDRLESTTFSDTTSKRVELKAEIKSKNLIALIFKVINDPKYGQIFYTRVYSGIIKANQEFKNTVRDEIDKATLLMRVQADEYKFVDKISFGDIIAISGLKKSITGDTLLNKSDKRDIVLAKPDIPEPVFLCSLENNTAKKMPAVKQAQTNLMIEDNSFTWEEDQETGQVILKGLGELHLETIKNRVSDEAETGLRLSKMRVSLRESISKWSSYTEKFVKTIRGRKEFFAIEIEIGPCNESDETDDQDELSFSYDNGNKISFDFLEDQVTFSYYKEYRHRLTLKKKSTIYESKDTIKSKKRGDFAIKEDEDVEEEVIDLSISAYNPHKHEEVGTISEEDPISTYKLSSLDFEKVHHVEQMLVNSFGRGPSLGQPLHSAHVRITGGEFTKNNTSKIGIGSCISIATLNCMNDCMPVIMEPIVKLTLFCPNDYTPSIISDVLKRSGKVEEFYDDSETKTKSSTKILARIPQTNTIGYSTWLRGETKGEAKFTMEQKGYEVVDQTRKDQVVADNFY